MLLADFITLLMKGLYLVLSLTTSWLTQTECHSEVSIVEEKVKMIAASLTLIADFKIAVLKELISQDRRIDVPEFDTLHQTVGGRVVEVGDFFDVPCVVANVADIAEAGILGRTTVERTRCDPGRYVTRRLKKLRHLRSADSNLLEIRDILHYLFDLFGNLLLTTNHLNA